jgi:hypothetical protein
MAAFSQPAPEAIRAKVEDIFARPEFSPDQSETLLQMLMQLLVRFFSWLGGLREAAPMLFWLLLIGCIVVLVVLLAHVSWTVWRVLSPRGQLAHADQERRERLSLGYRQEAGRLASLGDFTEAIRFLFLSLVYRFDETGRVSFQKAYTNREYLGLFDDNPDVRASLQVFVDTLDSQWYGQLPTEPLRYQSCRALFEKLT